VETREFPYNAV